MKISENWKIGLRPLARVKRVGRKQHNMCSMIFVDQCYNVFVLFIDMCDDVLCDLGYICIIKNDQLYCDSLACELKRDTILLLVY